MIKEAVAGEPRHILDVGTSQAFLSYHEPKEIFDGDQIRSVYTIGGGWTWRIVENPNPKFNQE